MLFGIKPNVPSKEYGYFLTKKIPNKPNKIIKFIEKPAIVKAKKLIKKGGCWNSGIFFARKDSIINHFKKYQSVLYKNCYKSVLKSKIKKNIHFLNKQAFIPRMTFLIYTNKNYSYKDFYSQKYRYFYLKKSLEKKYKFERIIFQRQGINKLGIVVHTKNIEFINSYINAKDEEVFKRKIITNFNKLFDENSLVNKLTFDVNISIMNWRASQPSGIAVPLSLQFNRKYRIGFCGDWFAGDGFGRIEGSILSALLLVEKFMT